MDLEFASDPSHPDWEPPHSLQLVEMDVYEAGTTPSPHSVRTRRAEALESGTRQLIQLCSSEGLLSVLDEFLTSWHDPHHPDRLQPNALAWFQEAEAFGRAIENGREDAVQILAAHGIQPQRPDIWAALDVLERTRNRSALDLLLKGGWEIDRPVNENATSILGCLIQDQASVEWVLSLGASPNAAGPMGETPMHRAAISGSLETLKLLVSRGGVVQGTDLVAHAALAYQSDSKDRLEVIRYLLGKGAPIDAYYMNHSEQWSSTTNSLYLSYGRQNALHFAISSGQEDLVEELLSRGAERTLEMYSLRTGFEKKTPQELATLLGHEDIAALVAS